MGNDLASVRFVGLARRRRERLLDREDAAVRLLSREYFETMGRQPDLRPPTTLSERLLWMRLYARDPLFPVLAERPQQMEYARAKGCERFLPRLYRALPSPRSDMRGLPERFALRASHLADEVLDGNGLDRAGLREARRAMRRWRGRSQYAETGEWEYRCAKPGATAEEPFPRDAIWRVLCMGGAPAAFYRAREPETLFDETGRALCGPGGEPPESMADMLALARTLAEGFAFVRLELAESGAGVRFLGMRFTETCAVARLWPGHVDRELGSRLRLPERGRQANRSI